MGRVLLYVHRWTGIILGLYVVVIGLSGAALVWQEDAARVFRVPQPAVREGVAQLDVDRVAEILRNRFPEMHLHTISWPSDPNWVWFAEVKKGEIGKPGETAYAVFLDPASGKSCASTTMGRAFGAGCRSCISICWWARKAESPTVFSPPRRCSLC